MIHFGKLPLDGTPRIAVPFRDGNDAAFIESAVADGADIAELRIDQFSRHDSEHVLAEIAKYQALPVLATIRSADEGGKWPESDAARLALYRAILPHVQAIDVELFSTAIVWSVIEAAREHKKPVILSFHDFTSTPAREDLDAIAARARDAGADIVKVAAMCNNQEDVRRLTAFTLDHVRDGVVAIGMGPMGVSTRILFPALGSLFTFAAYGEGTAPGQWQLEELSALFARLYPRG